MPYNNSFYFLPAKRGIVRKAFETRFGQPVKYGHEHSHFGKKGKKGRFLEPLRVFLYQFKGARVAGRCSPFWSAGNLWAQIQPLWLKGEKRPQKPLKTVLVFHLLLQEPPPNHLYIFPA